MNHKGIEFAIRIGLRRGEWVLLIYWPEKDEPSISKVTGFRADAIATAHKRIDGWLTRQQRFLCPTSKVAGSQTSFS
jgi:hypothetical protein